MFTRDTAQKFLNAMERNGDTFSSVSLDNIALFAKTNGCSITELDNFITFCEEKEKEALCNPEMDQASDDEGERDVESITSSDDSEFSSAEDIITYAIATFGSEDVLSAVEYVYSRFAGDDSTDGNPEESCGNEEDNAYEDQIEADNCGDDKEFAGPKGSKAKKPMTQEQIANRDEDLDDYGYGVGKGPISKEMRDKFKKTRWFK